MQGVQGLLLAFTGRVHLLSKIRCSAVRCTKYSGTRGQCKPAKTVCVDTTNKLVELRPDKLIIPVCAVPLSASTEFW
jgi:hypothetical protein